MYVTFVWGEIIRYFVRASKNRWTNYLLYNNGLLKKCLLLKTSTNIFVPFETPVVLYTISQFECDREQIR